jgi:hypothetical protein
MRNSDRVSVHRTVRPEMIDIRIGMYSGSIASFAPNPPPHVAGDHVHVALAQLEDVGEERSGVVRYLGRQPHLQSPLDRVETATAPPVARAASRSSAGDEKRSRTTTCARSKAPSTSPIEKRPRALHVVRPVVVEQRRGALRLAQGLIDGGHRRERLIRDAHRGDGVFGLLASLRDKWRRPAPRRTAPGRPPGGTGPGNAHEVALPGRRPPRPVLRDLSAGHRGHHTGHRQRRSEVDRDDVGVRVWGFERSRSAPRRRPGHRR